MKRTKIAALLALTLCLSACVLAAAAAQITAPMSAAEFEFPAIIDRLADAYGVRSNVAGVERTSDTVYRVHFDVCPYLGQFITPSVSYTVDVMLKYDTGRGAPQYYHATELEDDGLTCVIETEPGLSVEPTIEISRDYIRVPLDGSKVVAYKDQYYDLEGNPLSMDFYSAPYRYTFEYVDGALALVEYTDDEYDHTGERIIADYSRDTGALTNYTYSFYIGGTGRNAVGSAHLRYNGYGELERASYRPEKDGSVDYEWDFKRKHWYCEAETGGSGEGRNYAVNLPDSLPDPTTVAPPLAARRPEGYGVGFGADEFFGVPDLPLPMTAAEAEALGAALPFDAAALPKPVSYGDEGGDAVAHLAWDEQEAVRAALGGDGAITGEMESYFKFEDKRYGTSVLLQSAPIDIETLSARVENPEEDGEWEDDFSLIYDVKAPDGKVSVAYEYENGFSDPELSEIRATSGKYTLLYTPDGGMYGMEIQYAGEGYRAGACTCYYDETGALERYEYTPTLQLLAVFDLNGLSEVRYYLRAAEEEGGGTVTLWWTPEDGWGRGVWDEATQEFLIMPHEAPEGVDLDVLKPLI